MKKILFGITSLTLGGAERVLVDLANVLCDKYDVTIFTIYAKGELEKQLSPKVKRKTLYQNSYAELSSMQRKFIAPLKVLLGKKSIYRKKIKDNYDVEIAFLEGPVTRLFSVNNKKTRKIAWIHNDISLVFGNGIKSKIKKKLDKKIYSKYQTLVFVSRDNLKKFRTVYSEIRNKYLEPVKKEVIYNYIDRESVIKKAEEKQEMEFKTDILNFVTVARLVEQKAIDRLVEVHSKLIKKGYYHNFYVIGDGVERKKIEELIKKENVENTFHLLGKKENPYPYIKNADYFCLLSQFEGYGMVLEEAKILNKPILITDTAAREAVEKYENSKIFENTKKGIYDGMKEIIRKKKTNSNTNQKEIEKYDNHEIIEKVVSIIEKKEKIK